MSAIGIVVLSVAVAVVLFLIYGYIMFRRKYLTDRPEAFEAEIKAYEKSDLANPPGQGKMLFAGSSVMKFWTTLESDLVPLPVMNRAIAGTRIVQWHHYISRLVIPYKPSAVVLYAGSNDTHGVKAKQPQQILEAFIDFEKRIHAALPETNVHFLSILPSPNKARWENWSKICEVNALIEAYTKTAGNTGFIDATEAFIKDGLPRPELFRSDGVHLNAKGYGVWAGVARKALGV